MAKVLESVMFENWLRFYFITEKPDAPTAKDGQPALFIAVPVKGMVRGFGVESFIYEIQC